MILDVRHWLSALAVCGVLGAQGRDQADLFAADRVLDVQITIAKRDWNRLRMQSRSFEKALSAARKQGEFDKPYTYFDADVVIAGVRFARVGVRKKGFLGSQSGTRPSLKIKLNHTDPGASIQGLTNLTFNNNQQDVSLVSQFLGYQVFNAAGSPAPRCGFARVTVNGRYLGVYSHVERVRDTLLERGFGTAKGVLYEGTVVDFFSGWAKGFERKQGKRKRGLARIEALTAVLAEARDDELEARLGELVDLDAFYRFWALEGLLGFWDGYSGNKNNFFCYLHPDTDKFHFVPWGADCLFMKYSLVDDDREVPVSVKTTGLLAHRLYQLPDGRARYAAEMRGLLDRHWDEAAIGRELDRLEELLEPHLGRSQRRAMDSMNAVRYFVEKRRADILKELEGGMPIWTKKPKPPFAMPAVGGEWQPSIWDAAKRGDVEELQFHVRAGADVNSVSELDGSHPLALAALVGQAGAVKYLLQQGARVNDTDADGDTALHSAAFLGRVEVVELLLAAGAKSDLKNAKGATPRANAAAPWSAGLAGIIKWIGKAIGVDFDLEEIRAGRSKVARRLR
ncbi:MAG: CotH kinase family protein [Planctomycetota bacterium]|nr:CotH kinase family protein [Planctomycetota bacterium]